MIEFNERKLRAEIRKRMQRIVREEINGILGGLSAGAAGRGSAADEPEGRGGKRKRRKAGWLAKQVDKVLSAQGGQLVVEIAGNIGKGVSAGLVNAYLSRNEGTLFSSDNSEGPRKTRWSLLAGKGGKKKG